MSPRDIATMAGGPVFVFDLEYTTWPGALERGWSDPGEYREIVQIGAVRLDGRHDFREEGVFDILVRPRINQVLLDFIKELTGIRQEDVDAHGLDPDIAFARFEVFLGAASAPVLAFGRDAEILVENHDLHGIGCAMDMTRFYNARPTLVSALGFDNATSTSGAIQTVLGIEPSGDPHHALSDARGVAAALREAARQKLAQSEARRGAGS